MSDENEVDGLDLSATADAHQRLSDQTLKYSDTDKCLITMREWVEYRPGGTLSHCMAELVTQHGVGRTSTSDTQLFQVLRKLADEAREMRLQTAVLKAARNGQLAALEAAHGLRPPRRSVR